MFAFRLFVLFFVLCAVSPVQAGQVSYADSRGKWESTQCRPPAPFAKLAHDSEAAASDLNAYNALKSQYAAQMSLYLTCISQEAYRDATAVSQLVTESAKRMIEEKQQEVNALVGSPAAPSESR